MPARVVNADILGIGSPVYFLREAPFIRDYIASLPSLKGKKAFVFTTCGMDWVGEALNRMTASLSERGAEVVGAEWFRSAMSYHPYRKRGLGNPESFPGEAEMEAARAYGGRMAKAADLAPIKLEPVSTATRLKARLLALQPLRDRLFPRVRPKTAACTGYGSCLSRCLVGGLDRSDGAEIPYYKDACIQCLECIAWCPRGAIVVDSTVKEFTSTLSFRLGLH